MKNLGLRIGSIGFLTAGLLHTLFAAMAIANQLINEKWLPIEIAMMNHEQIILGKSVSIFTLMIGFSFVMGISLILIGLLFWSASPTLMTGLIGLLGSLLIAIFAYFCFPPPPLLLMLVSSVGFCFVLFSKHFR